MMKKESRKDITDYTLEALEKFLVGAGFPRFCARQIFVWIYKKRIEDFSLMTDIPQAGRKFLEDNFYFSQLKVLKRQYSQDKTEKFLFGLDDGSAIEAVFIPSARRNTLCISSQVGCKFDCKFCMSGKDGFKRDLAASEIVNQYLTVTDLISPRKITNIVFMGIGEPLDNFTHTMEAINIFMHPYGLYLGQRRICISTCGLIPQIKELAQLKPGVKLSVSLHSPFNGIRTSLMPVNKRYPLDELIKEIKLLSKMRYLVTFEYVLIKGLNTRKEDAQKLAHMLKRMKYKINIISYNVSSLGFMPPSQEEIDSFGKELKKRGVFFTLRKSRGQDISAACGQLRAKV